MAQKTNLDEIMELSLDEYIAKNGSKIKEQIKQNLHCESSFKNNRKRYFENDEEEDEDCPMSVDVSDLNEEPNDEVQHNDNLEEKRMKKKGVYRPRNLFDLRNKIVSGGKNPIQASSPQNSLMPLQPWSPGNVRNFGNGRSRLNNQPWQQQQNNRNFGSNKVFKHHSNQNRNNFPRKKALKFLNMAKNPPGDSDQNGQKVFINFKGKQIVSNQPASNDICNNRTTNLSPNAMSTLPSPEGLNVINRDVTHTDGYKRGSDIQSLLGFDRTTVRQNDMSMVAAKFLNFLHGEPMHKPMYDMKVQKEIKSLQRKPLVYRSSTEVVSSDGPGVQNLIINPKKTDITLNCRFSQ